jgi:hypothetical protein
MRPALSFAKGPADSALIISDFVHILQIRSHSLSGLQTASGCHMHIRACMCNLQQLKASD